jgi:very-short-patch-repair endonuclease
VKRRPVTYKGRAVVIEVEGPSHSGRRVADKLREKHLEEAGIVYVDRIAVEDTSSHEELDLAVSRFLTRLGG